MRTMVLLVAMAAVGTRVCAETAVIDQPSMQRADFFAQERAGDEPLTVSSDYEYSWVDQGGRSGSWEWLSVTASYSGEGDVSPYVSLESWERFKDNDYDVNAGAYVRLSDRSYVHGAFGLGMDCDYLYETLARVEYENKLIGPWNWFGGLRYLHYSANDVYILNPGLVYYFAQGYAQFFFVDSFTESRGSAQSVNIRAKVAASGRMAFYGAAAYGERLYDIFLLPASQQQGYMVAGGCEYRLTKQVRARAGFSYAHEDPEFIKRSLEAALAVRF